MFGGYEYDFEILVDLAIEAARACPSTGWVYGVYSAARWLIAGLPAEAQYDVWDENPDALVCGSFAPSGQAVVVDGGYKLTGRWSYSSGCDGAQWALCASMVQFAGERLAPAFLLVPHAHYIIDDTWHVSGLAGTGSKTIVIDGAFVPRHRLMTFRDGLSGRTPGRHLHTNPSFGMPMLCNLPSCLAATAIGAATGAIDSYIESTASRATRGAVAGAAVRMAEFPTIQLRLAEAAASVDAARDVLLRDLRLRAETVRMRQEISIEDRITSRRGQAFAVALSIRAVDLLNASTGGAGLDLSNPIQRAWRDVSAVGRHIGLNWDAVGTMYGQMALGLDPKGQF